MARAWRIMVAGVLLAGCVDEFDTAGESFGPEVTNECDQPVIVGIGDSLASAERDIRELPITMQSGWRSRIEFVVQREVVPERVFLLVGVDADGAAMLEFETSDIRHDVVETVFEADCRTLTRK